MADLGNTQYFEVQTDAPTGVKEVLACVYEALQENGYEFIDKVFTVYDDANAGGVNINCGARDCATCGRCYLKNDTVFINEKLK